MNRGIINIFLAFLLGAAVLDTHPEQEKQIARLESEIAHLRNQRADEIYKIYEIQASLDSLWNLHPYINDNSRKKMSQFAKIKLHIPATPFLLVGPWIDTQMDEQLYRAILDYTGPQVKITSLTRPKSHKSLHCKGKAVDIRGDDAGKQLATWLVTEEGKAWMARHHILMYLERIPDAEYRRGPFRQFIFDNPYATGPHIHLHISERKTN